MVGPWIFYGNMDRQLDAAQPCHKGLGPKEIISILLGYEEEYWSFELNFIGGIYPNISSPMIED